MILCVSGDVVAQCRPISYGETILDTLVMIGDVHCFKFVADAGDVITIRMSKSYNYIDPFLELYNPNDSLIIQSHTAGLETTISELRLETPGEYLIHASDYLGNEMGTYGLSLMVLNRTAPGQNQPLLYGETAVDSLTLLADVGCFAFSADSGDVVIVRFSKQIGYIDPHLLLYDPEGTRVAGASATTTQVQLGPVSLMSGGQHLIIASDYMGDETGRYGVCLQVLNRDVGGLPHTCNTTVTGDISLGETISYRFWGSAGTKVVIRMSKQYSYLDPFLELYDPSGQLVSSHYSTSQAQLNSVPLESDGVFTILASDYGGNETGDYGLSLMCLSGVSVGDTTAQVNTSFSVPINMFAVDSLVDFTLPLQITTNQPDSVRIDSVTFDPNVGDSIIFNEDSSIFVFIPLQPPPLPDSTYEMGRIYMTAAPGAEQEIFTIDTVEADIGGQLYTYELVGAGGGTVESFFTPGVITIQDVDDVTPTDVDISLPAGFKLGQNYPNPFNPITRIGFDLPFASTTRLDIYSILGRKVKTLVDSYLSPGGYTVYWHGDDALGRKVSSGVYFYRLQAGDFVASRKMLLLK